MGIGYQLLLWLVCLLPLLFLPSWIHGNFHGTGIRIKILFFFETGCGFGKVFIPAMEIIQGLFK